MPHRPSNIILITYRIYLHTSVMTFLVFVLLTLKFSSITRPYILKFFYSPTLQHFEKSTKYMYASYSIYHASCSLCSYTSPKWLPEEESRQSEQESSLLHI